MHDVSAEEGFVGVAYERRHSQWRLAAMSHYLVYVVGRAMEAYNVLHCYSRLHQFAKLYLYAASSGLYSCPLAMTDAAARLIEVWPPPSLTAANIPLPTVSERAIANGESLS